MAEQDRAAALPAKWRKQSHSEQSSMELAEDDSYAEGTYCGAAVAYERCADELSAALASGADTPDWRATLILAAEHADWQQVVLNGGPPCFHVEPDGRFCFRAERWDGHGEHHAFVSLVDALKGTR